jgi:hypothetical protein
MAWSRASPMDQKTQFIADYVQRRLSITELFEHYGISRKAATNGLNPTSARVAPAWPSAPGARMSVRPRRPRR